jgi:hypothetical protein
VLYLYGLYADVLRLVKGEGWRIVKRMLAFQSSRTVGELECHSVVSVLPMRAREGNNGAGVEQRSIIDSADAAGCCIQLYISLLERKQRHLLSYLI